MDENRLYEYDYDKPELSETYLEHHGVQGQKWGVKHGPPYPLSRQKGSGRLAKGRGSIQKKKPSGGLIERHKAKKTYKQRVQSAEKARQAKQAKAEEAKRAQEEQDKREAAALNEEMWRQDVIRRGDAETAAKYTDKFSNDEINAIINRYQTNQRLSQLVADANPKMADIPEVKRSKWEKMGEKVNEINKFAGPVSQLAQNASNIYGLYSKINTEKDRAAKESLEREKKKAEIEQAKANTEQTKASTKAGIERSKAEAEQIRANTENIKKGIFPTNNQQNNQQKQISQQPVQNQQKNSNNIPKELKDAVDKMEKDRKILNEKLQSGKISSEEYLKKSDKSIKKYAKSVDNYQKKTSNSNEQKNKIDWTKGQKWSVNTWKPPSASNNNQKKQQTQKVSTKESISKIASNPNTQGALSQLIKDATKNTRTLGGEHLHVNNDYLARQSTEALKLMKKSIAINDSTKYTIQDINKILKEREKKKR